MKNRQAETKCRQVATTFYQAIEGMIDGELDELIDQAMALTGTNCWWVEYHLKDVILEVAVNERQLRLESKGRS